ncbi:MAG: class I SAM-dependent methyltransferase [Bacteroidia bacterium]
MPFAKSKDIKDHVNAFIKAHASAFKNTHVIDLPAGSGITSDTLKNVGAKVTAFDLFPEFFKTEGISCSYADIMNKIPLENNCADWIICQEGIEHFENQFYALKEFNRVLKPNGKLIVTTPNYSNLRSKFSYLISESEYFSKFMSPNEIDSIWMTKKGDKRIYFGHIFLIGIQKLRCLAALSGFKIRNIYRVRTNKTSVWLLPIFYPFIYLFNWLIYKKSIRKTTNIEAIETYKEIFMLNTCISILTDSHLFVELEKTCQLEEVSSQLQGKITDFNALT